MKRIAILLIALMLMSVTCACTLAEGAVLTVRGSGVVSMDADTATITLGVREVSDDVVSAQGTVNAKIASVIEKLLEMGVNVDDIHTWSISIYPNYDYSSVGEQVVGYTADNTLSVTTKDIDNVGAYIDAAFAAGANTFSDISFSASDAADENDMALKLAVENAAAKAAVLAEASGMKVVGMRSISEEMYGYAENGAKFARAVAEETADGAATRVYASQLQVSASVTVEYALEPIE